MKGDLTIGKSRPDKVNMGITLSGEATSSVPSPGVEFVPLRDEPMNRNQFRSARYGRRITPASRSTVCLRLRS